jgi:hypothetical protein
MDPERLAKSARKNESKLEGESKRDERRERRRDRVGNVWSSLVERNRQVHNRAWRIAQASRETGFNQAIVKLPSGKSDNELTAHVSIPQGPGEGCRARIDFYATPRAAVDSLRSAHELDETWAARRIGREVAYKIWGGHPWEKAETEETSTNPNYTRHDELEGWDYSTHYQYHQRFWPVRAIGMVHKVHKVETSLNNIEDSLTMIEAAAADPALNPELAESLAAFDERQAAPTV